MISHLDPSFRSLMIALISKKPKELQELVEQKVSKVMEYLNQPSISRESLAIIIMQAECELERSQNANK